MKFEISELEVNTNENIEIIDITDKIKNLILRNKYNNGILTLYSEHTTAAITINEFEPNLMKDLEKIIIEIFRPNGEWLHNTIDDNAHAHLASSFIGNSRSLIVESGKISLGTWQRVLFIELDGPRKRVIKVAFIGE